MDWSLGQLIQAEQYPQDVYWPDDLEAFIPVPFDLNTYHTASIDQQRVQLFIKGIHSEQLIPLVWLDEEQQQRCVLDIPLWIKALQNELYRREHKKPITAMLPFHYHHIPGELRNTIASFLVKVNAQSGQKKNLFPRSIHNCGAEIFLGVCSARWGKDVLPKLILTHDIDTKAGFEWVERIAQIEEDCGFRSSWNIVPKHYSLNTSILDSLLERGHEIGLHGIWHNNSEAFLKEKQLVKQLETVKPIIEKYSIRGYRSPSWYKTQTMFKALSKYFIYDLSCLDNDMICPGGSGGVGFMRPFRLESGLIEFPCTLPFEVPLFNQKHPDDLVEFWKPKIQFIRNSQCLLLVNTHPDPNYSGNEKMLAVYRQFCQQLADEKWICYLPKDMAILFEHEHRTIPSTESN